MKIHSWLFMIMACMTLQANASDTVDLNLDAIKLNELTKIAFSEILHTGYIADDDFNREEKTVTVRLHNQTQSDIKEAISKLIQANGYQLEKQGSAFYISRQKQEDKPKTQSSTFYYQPRYRNVQYIADLVASVFDKGRFTFQRAVQSSPTQANTSTDTVKPADTGTNAYSQQSRNYDSFIFYGSDEEIAQLQKLLAQVDSQTGEILVKAYVYEVSDTNSKQNAFSIAVGLLNSKLSINAGQPLLNDSAAFSGAGIDAVFTALSTDSRFKVLTAPSLRVKDRENAKFSVGSEVPILGAISYPATGQSVQSVDYKSSGVILNIRPTIRSDSIELDINQQISNFVSTTTGVNNSPTLIKREIATVINCKNDDVIVLGGLEEHSSTESTSGQSWLPNFLRSRSKDQSKSDILLVLHVQRL